MWSISLKYASRPEIEFISETGQQISAHWWNQIWSSLSDTSQKLWGSGDITRQKGSALRDCQILALVMGHVWKRKMTPVRPISPFRAYENVEHATMYMTFKKKSRASISCSWWCGELMGATLWSMCPTPSVADVKLGMFTPAGTNPESDRFYLLWHETNSAEEPAYMPY